MTDVDAAPAGASSHLGQRATATGPRIVGPADGKYVTLGTIGVRFMIRGDESGGGVALVEHPIPPRGLAAPLHRHDREDEYSYVLEGRMGALLGDDVVYATAGDLVFKPRRQWHTFWNAGDTPCRILEIISPGGFERYFEELGDALAASGRPAPAIIAELDLSRRYAIEFKPESVAALCERFQLTFPGLRPPS